MASDIEICNMALRRIGVNPIVSMDETRQEARDCKLFFGQARDTVLRDHDWTFARKRRVLAPFMIPTDYAGKYQYGYVLPADCLKPRKVYEPGGSSPKKFELWRAPTNEKMLLADIAEALLQYTMVVTDPSWFDAEFNDALALKLASLLAWPLLKNTKLVDIMQEAYTKALEDSIVSDVEEHDPLPEQDETPWITARTTP